MNDQPLEPSKGERTRQRLVAAAYRIIAENGFEGLRVRDVADEVGVNSATLHYHFKTKEDLVAAVISFIQQSYISEESDQPPLAFSGASQFLQEITDFLNQAKKYPDRLVVLNELTLRSHRDSSIRDELAKMDFYWLGYLKSVLQTGLDDGSIAGSVDINTTALMTMALLKGLGVQLNAGLEIPDIDQLLAEIRNWIQTTE